MKVIEEEPVWSDFPEGTRTFRVLLPHHTVGVICVPGEEPFATDAIGRKQAIATVKKMLT